MGNEIENHIEKVKMEMTITTIVQKRRKFRDRNKMRKNVMKSRIKLRREIRKEKSMENHS